VTTLKPLTPDQINGCFELVAALFQIMNVVQLHSDKKTRGVRILPTFFFSLWGFWNLYYYPHLFQQWSFVGGLCLVVVNTAWLVQMFWYRGR
jgi:hypothetical protein